LGRQHDSRERRHHDSCDHEHAEPVRGHVVGVSLGRRRLACHRGAERSIRVSTAQPYAHPDPGSNERGAHRANGPGSHHDPYDVHAYDPGDSCANGLHGRGADHLDPGNAALVNKRGDLHAGA
jgi:hypothetical protein